MNGSHRSDAVSARCQPDVFVLCRRKCKCFAAVVSFFSFFLLGLALKISWLDSLGRTKGISLISLCYSFNFFPNMITPLTWMRSANGRKGVAVALVSSTNSLPISCFYRPAAAVVHPKVTREQTSLICSHKSPRCTPAFLPALVISNRPPFRFPA